MALLERYLDAVGRHLPAEEEEDILAELRDDIQARFDERAAELGRSLREDEEAELLKGYGRPILMAYRYKKKRHLVGPDLFPFYWTTLKVALSVAFVANLALLVLNALLGKSTGGMVERLIEFPFGIGVEVFAWVTIVFAVMELVASTEKFKDWDPRRLPRASRAGLSKPSRTGTAVELFFDGLFVVFWTWLYRSDGTFSLPPAVGLAPVWSGFYLPVLLTVLASMAAKCVTLVRPDMTRFRLASGVILTGAGVTVAALLLSAGQLVLPLDPGNDATKLARILDSVIRWSIGVGVLVVIVETAVEAWRWVRSRRRSTWEPA
jgi:hypothetical protein